MYDALAKVCSAPKFGKLLCQVHGDGNITHSNTPQHSENRNKFIFFLHFAEHVSGVFDFEATCWLHYTTSEKRNGCENVERNSTGIRSI